jgi:hypothetical protein
MCFAVERYYEVELLFAKIHHNFLIFSPKPVSAGVLSTRMFHPCVSVDEPLLA